MYKIIYTVIFLLMSTVLVESQGIVEKSLSYLRKHEFESAAITIDKAIIDSALKDLPTTWYYRGKVYQELFLSDETKLYALDTAYFALITAMTLDPDKEYLKNIIMQLKMLSSNYYRIGGSFFNINNYKEAYKMFEKALDINRTPMIAVADTMLIYYAGLSAKFSGNYSDAKKNFNKLIYLDVSNLDFPKHLGEMYENEKNTAEAISTYKYGVDKCNDNKGYYALKLVKLYMQNGKTADAEKYIAIAKDVDPNNAELYFLEADLYKLQMLDDKAIEAYNYGLQIKPDDYQANYNVGVMMYNNAMKHGQEAQKYKYKDDKVSLYKKETSIYNKYLFGSKDFLESAFKQHPDDVMLNKCLLDVYKRLNRDAQANEIKANMLKYGIEP